MSELSFEQMLEESFKTIHNGEVVEGTVIGVKEDEIILKDMLQSVVDLQIAMSRPEEEDSRSEYLGKSLMSILRMAAKYKINAEVALTQAIDTFIKDCSKE